MFQLLSAADEGLNLHVAGLPKWMAVKNIDHLSLKEKSRIVSVRSGALCMPGRDGCQSRRMSIVVVPCMVPARAPSSFP